MRSGPSSVGGFCPEDETVAKQFEVRRSKARFALAVDQSLLSPEDRSLAQVPLGNGGRHAPNGQLPVPSADEMVKQPSATTDHREPPIPLKGHSVGITSDKGDIVHHAGHPFRSQLREPIWIGFDMQPTEAAARPLKPMKQSN